MEKEEFNTLMGLFTGLSLVVISAFVYWNAQSITTFTASIIIAMGGLFLAFSRILTLVEIGSHRRWWFWGTISLFVLLTISFVPLWCVESVVIGQESTNCFYLNSWGFLFT